MCISLFVCLLVPTPLELELRKMTLCPPGCLSCSYLEAFSDCLLSLYLDISSWGGVWERHLTPCFSVSFKWWDTWNKDIRTSMSYLISKYSSIPWQKLKFNWSISRTVHEGGLKSRFDCERKTFTCEVCDLRKQFSSTGGRRWCFNFRKCHPLSENLGSKRNRGEDLSNSYLSIWNAVYFLLNLRGLH